MKYIFFLLFALIGSAYSTTFNFLNNCTYSVDVVYTANINEVPQPSVDLGTLGYGKSTNGHNFGSNVYFNIKNGKGGVTYAEFSVNVDTWQGFDSYDLSIILGFDTPVQILAPFNGFNPICLVAGCADAFQYPGDYSKVHAVQTGGTFTVVFCP